MENLGLSPTAASDAPPPTEDEAAIRGKSALAVARELRAAGVTVRYAGRDNWRQTVAEEVRRQGGADGSIDDFKLVGDELRGSVLLQSIRARRGEAARLTQAEALEEQRQAAVAAGACHWCVDARFVLVGELRLNGKMYTGTESMVARDVAPCPVCNAGDSREYLLEKSELPASQQDWTFATFPADSQKSDARDRVSQWVEAVADGATDPLLLVGANGRGKTSLASAAVNALLDRHVQVRFAYLPGMLQEIRRRFGGEGDEATEYLDRLLLVPVLVLDDLAAPNVTSWVQETIMRIIAERLIANLPTLITLDESPEWIERHFHHRVASRLKLFGVVTVPGEDLRERTQRERWWV